MNNEKEHFTLPHSIDAEKAVLGALLRDKDNINAVSGKLQPRHFFSDTHRLIYEVILELDSNNKPADFLTVAERLRQTKDDDSYKGPAYLVELTENCPVSQNVEHYSDIVRYQYYLRKIIFACQDTMKRAVTGGEEISTFIEVIEKEFLEITNDQDTRGLIPASEILNNTLKELEERIKQDSPITGVPSGFSDLDNITGGWQKSDLIVIAARPSMGKTGLALNCAINAIKAGHSVAIFSLEMPDTQLMMRALSAEARVDSSKLRKGDLTGEEQDCLMHGARTINKLQHLLAIDETPGINLTQIRSRCRRFKKEHGIGLVIIDYLQLMTSHSNRRTDSREREISEISMGLKGLAKELKVPIIALAQLNRSPEKRQEHRPNLSDIRESGSVEQDADVILFIYRDDVYNPSSEDSGKAEIIIGKNRHGPTGKVVLAYQPNFVSFHNFLSEN